MLGFARKLRSRLSRRRPCPAILMYHRVVAPRLDLWDLAVSPEVFDQQMRYLKDRRTPLAMDELVSRLQKGTLPGDAVGVTFDDGYRDNLVNAKPILERYGVPATVFVATGYVDRKMPFWWDELARMVLESPEPVEIVQRVGAEEVRLSWGPPEKHDSDPSWRGWDEPRTARQRGYLEIWRRLQSASDEERESVMRSLRESLTAKWDSLAEPMTTPEYALLTSTGLITLGGHTVTHPALTDLGRTESRQQIEQGAIQCRALAPGEVNGFAYPYGNFDEEVTKDLMESTFSWACTTTAEFLDNRDPDVYCLPRLTVTDGAIEDFATLISG